MKYLDKSFSVSMSNVSQETWDRIFKGTATSTTVPEAGAPPAEGEATASYADRQCAACLERGHLSPMVQDGEEVPGMLQCGICSARFALGVEVAAKFHGDAACTQCDGTGHLRSSFVVFGCATCGGTGARQK